MKNENLSAEAILFGESPSRIVVSFSADKSAEIEAIAGNNNCPFAVIGKVSGKNLNIKINGKPAIIAPVAELENVWAKSLENKLER